MDLIQFVTDLINAGQSYGTVTVDFINAGGHSGAITVDQIIQILITMGLM